MNDGDAVDLLQWWPIWPLQLHFLHPPPHGITDLFGNELYCGDITRRWEDEGVWTINSWERWWILGSGLVWVGVGIIIGSIAPHLNHIQIQIKKPSFLWNQLASPSKFKTNQIIKKTRSKWIRIGLNSVPLVCSKESTGGVATLLEVHLSLFIIHSFHYVHLNLFHWIHFHHPTAQPYFGFYLIFCFDFLYGIVILQILEIDWIIYVADKFVNLSTQTICRSVRSSAFCQTIWEWGSSKCLIILDVYVRGLN